jgi:hypothetical protein
MAQHQSEVREGKASYFSSRRSWPESDQTGGDRRHRQKPNIAVTVAQVSSSRFATGSHRPC